MSAESCEFCGGEIDAAAGVCRACVTAVQSDSGTLLSDSAPHAHQVTSAPSITGYEVIGSLGEGGMGAVYLAEETALGRRVAIKVMSGRLAAEGQAKARFLREARTLATIEHPHVVRVYAFGEAEGQPYLAMEYVEGETLTDQIRRLGKLPLDRALRIARDVVEALEAAWERNVVHRDIKPSNILIDRRGRVRVADFGLAKAAEWNRDASLTGSGLMIGTPHYMSPEQAQGKETDFRADFYSLGIMLFHMLTGERPFDASTPVAVVARHLHEPMPLASARSEDDLGRVDDLIQWLTQKDPSRRPSSHAELLAAIDALQSRTPSPGLPTFSAVPAAPPSQRHFTDRRRLIASAVLLSLIAAVMVFFTRAPHAEAPADVRVPKPFVVAVAPFYGPDEDSIKEGRVMAALIERAVSQRLGKAARVVGIEQTETAVRSHDEARALGQKLNASIVVWGEAFALRRETEIQPQVTRVTEPVADGGGIASATRESSVFASARAGVDLLDSGSSAPVKLQAEAPNQIELRKMSASGIGDVVLLLAGIHALETEKDAQKALAFFEQAPLTAETLRYKVRALTELDRRDEATAALVKSIELDSTNASAYGVLGDLHLAAGRHAEAVAAYRSAAALGQPYSTSRGIVFEEKLYMKEIYPDYNNAGSEEVETVYLLALDPRTFNVSARWALPGIPMSFETTPQGLSIRYKAFDDEGNHTATLLLRDGKFDKPLLFPANQLWRVRSMRSGRVLSFNFEQDFGVRELGQPGGKFRLSADPVKSLPMTLPALEQALRRASERDPTQPWHLYQLAYTLKQQNRMAEANATFDELIRRRFPGVPYYEYTWMLNTLERLREYEWVDRLYPKALSESRAQRREPEFSLLIDRLINASFVRQAATNQNIDRGYTALVRARTMTGLVGDGDDLAATAWANYFDARGDEGAARRERTVAAQVRAHPFNYLRAHALLDYAFAAAVTAFFALAALLAGVLTLRLWERTTDGEKQGGASRRIRITRAERRALLLLAIMFATAVAVWVDRVAHVTTLGALPIGFVEGLGHPYTIADLEKRMATDGTNVALRYVTAVANHYGGNVARASQLYGAVPDGYADVRVNRADAAAGRAPSRYPDAEVIAASLGVNAPERWRDTTAIKDAAAPLGRSVGEFTAAAAVLLLSVGLLLILLPVGEPSHAAPVRHRGLLFVPALFDVSRGRIWRAVAMLLLVGIVVTPALLLIKTKGYVVATGFSTLKHTPNLPVAFPLPSADPQPMRALSPTIGFGYAYGRLYWATAALALVGSVTLFVTSVVQVIRETRREAEPARATSTAS